MLPTLTFDATPFHNHATGDFAGYWLHNRFGTFARLTVDDGWFFVGMEEMAYGLAAGVVHCLTLNPDWTSTLTEYLSTIIDDNFDVWIQEEEAKFYNVEVCAHRHCGWATTLAGEDYWVCEDCGGEM